MGNVARVACLIYNVCTYFCNAAITAGCNIAAAITALIGEGESRMHLCSPARLSQSIFLQLLIRTNYLPITIVRSAPYTD